MDRRGLRVVAAYIGWPSMMSDQLLARPSTPNSKSVGLVNAAVDTLTVVTRSGEEVPAAVEPADWPPTSPDRQVIWIGSRASGWTL